jgi:small-conductance mechanosensitive channel
VFFLSEDAFRIGEYIQVGTTRGTVEGIAIRSVRLRHHRGPVHTLPFGEIKQLTNYSRDWIIMKLDFLLAFGTDLQKVRKLVKKVGEELSEHPSLGPALLDRVKSQGVRRMEPTGVVVGIKFMATPGSEVYLLRREIYQRLLDVFEKNGIEFAKPQVLVASAKANSSASDTAAAAAWERTADPRRVVPQP